MLNKLKLVLGTLNFDYNHVSSPFNQEKVNDFLEISKQNDIDEIDTAYYYKNSEKIIGNSPLKIEFKISSKANPWYNNDFTNGKLGQLNDTGIKTQLYTSLNNLNINNLDIYYLHAWDYETDINCTLETIDELYRKEYFNKLGICNFSINQLQNVLDVIDKNNYINVDSYQSIYNLYNRSVEEILPLLRDNNITFYAYNPLAGGLLTGKYNNTNQVKGRYYNNKIYKDLFWNSTLVDKINQIPNVKNLSLRWLRYNSKLLPDDRIILGASTTEQLLSNINDIKQGSLSNDTLKLIDDFRKDTLSYETNYYY